jgi:hypothetical protein
MDQFRKDTWLAKLEPDKIGKPYVDARAHRCFWESVERIARNKICDLNMHILDGDLSASREITKAGFEQIEASRAQFVKNYALEE